MGQSKEGAKKVAAKLIGMTTEEYLEKINSGLKHCISCKEWHTKDKFRKDKSRPDGLAYRCKSRKPPISKEEKRKRYRKWYRKYYAGKGGPKIRAQKYARKRGCEVIDQKDRAAAFTLTGGRCVYCGGVATTIDHMVPVIDRGHSRRGNMVPACGSCNSSKKNRPLDEFLKVAKNPDIDAIIDELIMGELPLYGRYNYIVD